MVGENDQGYPTDDRHWRHPRAVAALGACLPWFRPSGVDGAYKNPCIIHFDDAKPAAILCNGTLTSKKHSREMTMSWAPPTYLIRKTASTAKRLRTSIDAPDASLSAAT